MADPVVAPLPEGKQTPSEYIPPQGEPKKEEQKPLTVKAGDKYREAFAKLEKVVPKEPATPEATKTEQLVKPEESTGDKQEEVKTEAPTPEGPVEKPESPLDVVSKEKKAAAEETPDVLKDFDEVNPDWKKARGVMRDQSTRLKELESKLKELETQPKADPAVVQERDSLKTKLAEQEEKIKAMNAEYSDEYKGLVQKRDDIREKIGNRAKSYGADAQLILDALQLPEGRLKTQQIKEALAEVEPEDKSRIYALMETFEERQEAINEFRKDLPGKWDKLQAKEAARAAESQAEQIKVLETHFNALADELPNGSVTLKEVSEDIPGAEDWNKAIKVARETALRILKPGGSDFKETASIAFKGAHYDDLESRYLQMYEDLKDANKRLKEYEGATPDIKGTPKPKADVKKTPAQRYHEALSARSASTGEP